MREAQGSELGQSKNVIGVSANHPGYDASPYKPAHANAAPRSLPPPTHQASGIGSNPYAPAAAVGGAPGPNKLQHKPQAYQQAANTGDYTSSIKKP